MEYYNPRWNPDSSTCPCDVNCPYKEQCDGDTEEGLVICENCTSYKVWCKKMATINMRDFYQMYVECPNLRAADIMEMLALSGAKLSDSVAKLGISLGIIGPHYFDIPR